MPLRSQHGLGPFFAAPTADTFTWPFTTGHLDIWRIKLSTDDTTYARLVKLLAAEERERANRFYFEEDRRKFCIGRGVLRVLTAGYCRKHATEVQFAYNPFGKPQLQGELPLSFNLSHAAGWCLIVFGSINQLGIDLEAIDPNVNVEDLAQRFFAAAESKQVVDASPAMRPELFFRCWTRKEAFIKAHGAGLSLPLHEFEVSLSDREKASVLHINWAPEEKDAWWMSSFSPEAGMIAAVAAKGRVESLRMLHWTGQFLTNRTDLW